MPALFGRIRIFEGKQGQALLYCTDSDCAFGPIFESVNEAEAFCEWLRQHPRVDLRRMRNPALRGDHPSHFSEANLKSLVSGFHKIQQVRRQT